MGTIKFDTVLNMSDPDFAQKLMDAIGVKKGDAVNIITPQFTRTDGIKVNPPLFDFAKLHTLSDDALKDIGCQKWDVEDDITTWLYPAEWYDHIPDGTEITTISGNRETFKHGVTDDDMRFGALSFGFTKVKP